MALAVEAKPLDERVFITGVEAITPLGLTLKDSVDALERGEIGIKSISKTLGYRVHDEVDVAGLITGFEPTEFIFPTEVRDKIHRSAQLMYVAGARAMIQAGFLKEMPPVFKGSAEDFIATMFPQGDKPARNPGFAERFGIREGATSLVVNINPQDIGISLGSGVGGTPFAADIEDYLLYKEMTKLFNEIPTHDLNSEEITPEQRASTEMRNMIKDRIDGIFQSNGRIIRTKTSSGWILQLLPDRPIDVLANKLGMMGPGALRVGACAGGLIAMGDGYEEIIKSRTAKAMLVGGVEAAVDRIGVLAFAAMTALHATDDPERASYPFYQGKGFVMAEMGAGIVLELGSHAVDRGAKILGEVLGYATNLDGYDDTAPRPHGEGAVIVMKKALEMAGIDPDDVDAVHTHATSTPTGDGPDLEALIAVFGEEKVKNMPISALKGFIAHGLGASGAVETALGIELARRQFLPANRNPLNNEPIRMDVDLIVTDKHGYKQKIKMQNSFGFGGKVASLVYAVYDEEEQLAA